MRELGDLLKELDKVGIYKQAIALKGQLPSNGILTCELASALQTQFATVTIELSILLAKAEFYAEKAERLKDDCLTEKTGASEEKSEAAKGREAKATKEYRALADERAVAKVLLNHIANFKKSFDNMVYVMRSRQDKEARDWQATPTSETR